MATSVWSWRPTGGDGALRSKWVAHSFETSKQLEAAHRFRERHHRRTGSVDIAAAGGQRFSADILTMTMTERDRTRVGDKLFASSNGNGALRCDLRRETCDEWTARTGLPPPSPNADSDGEGASAVAARDVVQPPTSALAGAPAGLAAPADSSSGSDDESDMIHPGQLMKVLALEIDKPATKVSLASHAPRIAKPQRQPGAGAPAAAPQRPRPPQVQHCPLRRSRQHWTRSRPHRSPSRSRPPSRNRRTRRTRTRRTRSRWTSCAKSRRRSRPHARSWPLR